MTKIFMSIAGALVLTVATGILQAAPLVSWDLQDYNGDGLHSDMDIAAPPPGNYTPFGFADETGCVNASDGDTCEPIAFDSGPIDIDVFTSGFNLLTFFGPAKPKIFGNISADITGGVLTFSAFDWGIVWNGNDIFLPPDGGPNNIVVEDITNLGDLKWGVVIHYRSTIVGGAFDGQQFFLRLEGVMSMGLDVDIIAEGGFVQECTSFSGSHVELQAEISLSEGAEVISVIWTIDGAFAGEGPAITPLLAPGDHSVDVTLTTTAGSASDSVEISVVDTSPPALDAAFLDRRIGNPISTISSNRVHFVITSFEATDICDPAPVSEGVVTAFEVENGDTIKVQGKKNHIQLETSTLELSVTATDASGNTSTETATLSISE
jgi:hypothetical protein